MRHRSLGASAVAVLASAACALCTGCALFTDLNSDQYSLVDAGREGGTCAPDASCPLVVAVVCQQDCSSTQVCCASATASGSIVGQCLDPSTCSSQLTSTALCTGGSPCAGGGACMGQTCTFMGSSVTVYACASIPTCKAL